MACIATGDMTGQDALEFLAKAGTGKEYSGLWRDVEAFSPPNPSERLPELVEVAEVIRWLRPWRSWTAVSTTSSYARRPPGELQTDHPDLVSAQEALLVREGLHEAGRNLTNDHDQQFKTWLRDAEKTARGLENALRQGQATQANDKFLQVQKSCKQCHAKYRD